MSQGAELAIIETHESAVAQLVDQARTHRIVDDASRGLAADLRGAVKQAEARVEEARTSLVKPLNDHVKSINARFKPFTDSLAAAVRAIDGEIIRDRREREAAAEAERRRIEAEAAQKHRQAEEEQAARAREAAAKAEADAFALSIAADPCSVVQVYSYAVAEGISDALRVAPERVIAATIDGQVDSITLLGLRASHHGEE